MGIADQGLGSGIGDRGSGSESWKREASPLSGSSST
jgi:hypothetical protein